ncbi:restriction endonuclease subunit S [Leuconostoc mesenteroides]|uniref:restriction endonuclease subunit S n=1 Tax=Leuconostoc mesenteroides TaxID=1245 RepID=UPI0023605700|nr:restriction endonuclease subunit S [Leuconostoc mesenteroides]
MNKMTPQIRFQGFTDDWEERKFKDILKTYSFRSYLANASDHGKYEVIQQGDNPLVGYSDGTPFMDYKDIILFGDHTVSLYKPQSPFFISTDGVKILSADNFEGNYLYTTLERYKPNSQGYKRHFTILKNQELWFTRNVEEQQKVGLFFKQLDNTIALHQRKLDLLKEQKKGFLQKMFPKNGAKIPELRFEGFSDDWEERKLGEVSKYSNGGSYENDVVENGTYELITLKSVNMSGKLVSSGKFINRENKTLEKDTLVMILSEQAPGLLGMTAKIPENNRYVLNQRVAEIKPNTNIDSYFLSMSINRSQAYFSKRGAGTKVQNISKPNVENFEFYCPSEREQQKIGSFFKQIDNTIALHQIKLDLLKKQKKGFLQRMFVDR